MVDVITSTYLSIYSSIYYVGVMRSEPRWTLIITLTYATSHSIKIGVSLMEVNE